MFSLFGCHKNTMEQEQFKQKVLPQRLKLYGYALRLLECPEDAEDILQEVYLKLWSIRRELDRYDNLPALAMQITKNLCLNRLKTRNRIEGDLTELSIPDNASSPYERLEEKDSVDQVMRIIDRLPDLQQSILRMKHVEGMEVEEIAALTGSKPEAIRMNLSRARKRVKDLFFKLQKP